MADSEIQQFLLCYDIADEKRLLKVHRCLKQQGLPIQYSVFTVELKRPALQRLLAQLNALINLAEDDVRCYTLPKRPVWQVIGRQLHPEGVFLLSESGGNRLLGN